jgi:hypothetical protein
VVRVNLRIERGNPTPEEIAALLAVLTKKRETKGEPEPRWATTAKAGFFHPDGRPTRPGPDGWRTSALPR